MASLWTTYAALRSEIGNTIAENVNTLRNAYKDKDSAFSFAGYEETDVSKRFTGRPRQVRIGTNVEHLKYEYIASTFRGHRLRIPIEISYPSTGTWPIAALDDYDLIAEYFRDNTRSTSGVQLCVCDLDVPPRLEPHEKDPWVFLRFAMLAIVEVS